MVELEMQMVVVLAVAVLARLEHLLHLVQVELENQQQ
jgi:hypothetical protein